MNIGDHSFPTNTVTNTGKEMLNNIGNSLTPTEIAVVDISAAYNAFNREVSQRLPEDVVYWLFQAITELSLYKSFYHTDAATEDFVELTELLKEVNAVVFNVDGLEEVDFDIAYSACATFTSQRALSNIVPIAADMVAPVHWLRAGSEVRLHIVHVTTS